MTNAQAFEDLFTRVLRLVEPGFIQIKPHGNIGDLSNDGFVPSKGVYYQVYAPEDITVAKTQATAITKLISNFTRLNANWNHHRPILEFQYVINDKYRGINPNLAIELLGISNQFAMKAEPFTAKKLEDLFMLLSESEMSEVLESPILSPENIGDIDYSILSEVINHLNGIECTVVPETFTLNPDFDKKIQFNSLSTIIARVLEYGRINNYVIDDFFQNNSDFTKQELRDIFASLYEEGKQLVQQGTTSDEVFVYILERATPVKARAHQEAVKLLMAYYFEHCDIFEVPTSF